ncbi:hypothetical protein LEMLEM_LOCUS5423 [Lemmus lemmus]
MGWKPCTTCISGR